MASYYIMEASACHIATGVVAYITVDAFEPRGQSADTPHEDSVYKVEHYQGRLSSELLYRHIRLIPRVRD